MKRGPNPTNVPCGSNLVIKIDRFLRDDIRLEECLLHFLIKSTYEYLFIVVCALVSCVGSGLNLHVSSCVALLVLIHALLHTPPKVS